jgi:hypothetical protein
MLYIHGISWSRAAASEYLPGSDPSFDRDGLRHLIERHQAGDRFDERLALRRLRRKGRAFMARFRSGPDATRVQRPVVMIVSVKYRVSHRDLRLMSLPLPCR